MDKEKQERIRRKFAKMSKFEERKQIINKLALEYLKSKSDEPIDISKLN